MKSAPRTRSEHSLSSESPLRLEGVSFANSSAVYLHRSSGEEGGGGEEEGGGGGGVARFDDATPAEEGERARFDRGSISFLSRSFVRSFVL